MQKDLGSQFKKTMSGQFPPEAVDADAHDRDRRFLVS
jgi:hypothetical protein